MVIEKTLSSVPLNTAPFIRERESIGSMSSASSEQRITTGPVRVPDASPPPQRPPPAPGTAGRFKVLGTLVVAMQRFQDALNPSYTFGKRASDPGTTAAPTSTRQSASLSGGDAPAATSGPGSRAYGRSLSGRAATAAAAAAAAGGGSVRGAAGSGSFRGAAGTAAGDRSSSGRPVSGRPSVAGIQHGHKSNILFKPLPSSSS